MVIANNHFIIARQCAKKTQQRHVAVMIAENFSKSILGVRNGSSRSASPLSFQSLITRVRMVLKVFRSSHLHNQGVLVTSLTGVRNERDH